MGASESNLGVALLADGGHVGNAVSHGMYHAKYMMIDVLLLYSRVACHCSLNAEWRVVVKLKVWYT